MNEGGHYYTVYFTSLAVGFSNDVAFRHAVFAQMPDEVESLDATELQKSSVIRELAANYVKSHSPFFPIDDLLLPPTKWRYLINFAIHCLVDNASDINSSSYQTERTKDLLRRYDPYSLEFGFLLHRLGDTYAHRVMGNEKRLYQIKKDRGTSRQQGHLLHWRDPDYEFLRPKPFLEYLGDLHSALYEKAIDPQFVGYCKRFTPMSAEKLKIIYSDILENVNSSLKVNPRWPTAPRGSGVRNLLQFTKEEKELFFCQQIRDHCRFYLQEEMEPSYTPEHIQALPFNEFLKKNPGLEKLGVGEPQIRMAIINLYEKLKTPVPELNEKERTRLLI